VRLNTFVLVTSLGLRAAGTGESDCVDLSAFRLWAHPNPLKRDERSPRRRL